MGARECFIGFVLPKMASAIKLKGVRMWEYKSIFVDLYADGLDLILNEFGRDGWDLAVMHERHDLKQAVVVFKRFVHRNWFSGVYDTFESDRRVDDDPGTSQEDENELD
jgi:hypothetical protein